MLEMSLTVKHCHYISITTHTAQTAAELRESFPLILLQNSTDVTHNTKQRQKERDVQTSTGEDSYVTSSWF